MSKKSRRKEIEDSNQGNFVPSNEQHQLLPQFVDAQQNYNLMANQQQNAQQFEVPLHQQIVDFQLPLTPPSGDLQASNSSETTSNGALSSSRLFQRLTQPQLLARTQASTGNDSLEKLSKLSQSDFRSPPLLGIIQQAPIEQRPSTSSCVQISNGQVANLDTSMFPNYSPNRAALNASSAHRVNHQVAQPNDDYNLVTAEIATDLAFDLVCPSSATFHRVQVADNRSQQRKKPTPQLKATQPSTSAKEQAEQREKVLRAKIRSIVNTKKEKEIWEMCAAIWFAVKMDDSFQWKNLTEFSEFNKLEITLDDDDRKKLLIHKTQCEKKGFLSEFENEATYYLFEQYKVNLAEIIDKKKCLQAAASTQNNPWVTEQSALVPISATAFAAPAPQAQVSMSASDYVAPASKKPTVRERPNQTLFRATAPAAPAPKAQMPIRETAPAAPAPKNRSVTPRLAQMPISATAHATPAPKAQMPIRETAPAAPAPKKPSVALRPDQTHFRATAPAAPAPKAQMPICATNHVAPASKKPSMALRPDQTHLRATAHAASAPKAQMPIRETAHATPAPKAQMPIRETAHAAPAPKAQMPISATAHAAPAPKAQMPIRETAHAAPAPKAQMPIRVTAPAAPALKKPSMTQLSQPPLLSSQSISMPKPSTSSGIHSSTSQHTFPDPTSHSFKRNPSQRPHSNENSNKRKRSTLPIASQSASAISTTTTTSVLAEPEVINQPQPTEAYEPNLYEASTSSAHLQRGANNQSVSTKQKRKSTNVDEQEAKIIGATTKRVRLQVDRLQVSMKSERSKKQNTNEEQSIVAIERCQRNPEPKNIEEMFAHNRKKIEIYKNSKKKGEPVLIKIVARKKNRMRGEAEIYRYPCVECIDRTEFCLIPNRTNTNGAVPDPNAQLNTEIAFNANDYRRVGRSAMQIEAAKLNEKNRKKDVAADLVFINQLITQRNEELEAVHIPNCCDQCRGNPLTIAKKHYPDIVLSEFPCRFMRREKMQWENLPTLNPREAHQMFCWTCKGSVKNSVYDPLYCPCCSRVWHDNEGCLEKLFHIPRHLPKVRTQDLKEEHLFKPVPSNPYQCGICYKEEFATQFAFKFGTQSKGYSKRAVKNIYAYVLHTLWAVNGQERHKSNLCLNRIKWPDTFGSADTRELLPMDLEIMWHSRDQYKTPQDVRRHLEMMFHNIYVAFPNNQELKAKVEQLKIDLERELRFIERCDGCYRFFWVASPNDTSNGFNNPCDTPHAIAWCWYDESNAWWPVKVFELRESGTFVTETEEFEVLRFGFGYSEEFKVIHKKFLRRYTKNRPAQLKGGVNEVVYNSIEYTTAKASLQTYIAKLNFEYRYPKFPESSKVSLYFSIDDLYVSTLIPRYRFDGVEVSSLKVKRMFEKMKRENRLEDDWKIKYDINLMPLSDSSEQLQAAELQVAELQVAELHAAALPIQPNNSSSQ